MPDYSLLLKRSVILLCVKFIDVDLLTVSITFTFSESVSVLCFLLVFYAPFIRRERKN